MFSAKICNWSSCSWRGRILRLCLGFMVKLSSGWKSCFSAGGGNIGQGELHFRRTSRWRGNNPRMQGLKQSSYQLVCVCLIWSNSVFILLTNLRVLCVFYFCIVQFLFLVIILSKLNTSTGWICNYITIQQKDNWQFATFSKPGTICVSLLALPKTLHLNAKAITHKPSTTSAFSFPNTSQLILEAWKKITKSNIVCVV